MKRFIFKISIFLVPILFIAIGIEILIRHIPNDYKYKKKYLDKNAKSINKLFLGSSHAFYGINPKYVTKNGFNAGNISQSLDLDYKIIDKYQNDFENLDYIIIPIDYFTLFSRLKTGVEYWRIKNYNIYWDMNLSNKINENSELLSLNFRFNLQRIKSYYLIHYSSLNCDKLGFGYKFKKQSNLEKTGIKAAKRHTKELNEYYDDSIDILEKIIQIGKKKNISIIFYTSPAYKTYYSHLNNKQLALTTSTIRKIANKYNNCFYYNLLKNKKFDSTDFRDADHLNPKGAKKLSKLLDSLMIKTNS